ncbi:MAG: carbohydrate kinase family protein, partial [Geodermatophilaceae bacterium]
MPDQSRAPVRDVLVVGDINRDVLVRPDRPIERGTDVPAQIRQRPGGAGANVAVELGRLGTATTLAGCVGAIDSTPISDLIRATGVQLALRACGGLPTGTIVVIIDADGERSMASDRGANLALTEADLPEALIAEHRHLHVSGYTLLDPGTRAAAVSAIGRAQALGRTVSVDPASVAPLRGYGVEHFLSDIEGIDVLLPNADEAHELSGFLDVEQAALCLAEQFPLVAVTCGAAGALWADRSGVLRRPSLARRDHVMDTTGAGDAFTAGLLAAWLDGQSPTDCLDAGQRSAAAVVARWGAREGRPSSRRSWCGSTNSGQHRNKTDRDGQGAG